MGRFRLFAAAIAAAATVAGLASAGTAAAAPTTAPGRAHRSVAHASTPAPSSGAAVQWTRGTDGKAAGLIHYPGGATARITEGNNPQPAGRVAALRTATGRSTGLSAEAPAHPALTAADVPSADQATISGRVTDTQGHPLAGVQVQALDDSDATLGSTSTNANGHYTLTVAPGDYYLEYDGSNATGGNSDATGYVGASEDIHLTTGDHLIRNERLQSGALVRVRVTDRSGHPLAGVAPYVQPVLPYVQKPTSGGFAIGFSFDTSAVTGADGTYALRGLPAEALLVCFAADGEDVTGGADDRLGYTDHCSRLPIAPAPGSSSELPTVRLASASGGVLHGVVTTAGGQPVAGASVYANSRAAGGLATTGSHGSYRLSGLPPGRYQVCAFEPTPAPSELGLRPACGVVRVERDTVRRADLTLHRGGAVSGTVTGPTGAPVAGVGVDVTGAGINGGYGVTDADGNYAVNGLATGAYRVCFDTSEALDPGSPTGDRDGCYRHKAEVTVHAGSERHHVDAQLRLAGAIAGRVTGAGDVGLDDVDVEVQSVSSDAFGEGVTDANGNYQVTGLAPGSYLVCFFTFDLASLGGSQKCDRVTVQVGRTSSLDESFAPPASSGTIAVTVRDEQGRRVQGVDVGVLKPCRGSNPFLCESEPLFGHTGHAKLVDSRTNDATGTARVDGRKPGTYAVCLFAYYGVTTAGAPPDGYSDRCAGRTFSVTVRPGATTRVHLTLHPGGRVEGRVVDPTGHPVPRVQALVAHSAAADYVDDFGGLLGSLGGGTPQSDARTHADGTFTVRGVRPGSDQECVQVRPNSKYLARCAAKPLVVKANETTHAPDLKLAKAGAISGVVRDAAGHPLDHVGILILTVGRPTEVAGFGVASSHGHYRVGSLVPGRYVACFIATHRVAECYHQVRWSGKANPTRLKGLTPVKVVGGHTTTGIDAELRRQN